MKNIKALCSKIAAIEGKKTNARIGEIREIVSIISDLMHSDGDIITLLWENGETRNKKFEEKPRSQAGSKSKLKLKTTARKFSLKAKIPK